MGFSGSKNFRGTLVRFAQVSKLCLLVVICNSSQTQIDLIGETTVTVLVSYIDASRTRTSESYMHLLKTRGMPTGTYGVVFVICKSVQWRLRKVETSHFGVN